MDERALFTKFWEDESTTTGKVISRIPEGSDYRPDPKSRTAREIAWQIVCEEKMLIDALETGKAEWQPSPAPESMKEMHGIYEKQSADIVKRLKDSARRAVERHARVLRRSATGAADGVELLVRHRAPSRADHDVPASDGLDRPADLRTERGRAVGWVRRRPGGLLGATPEGHSGVRSCFLQRCPRERTIGVRSCFLQRCPRARRLGSPWETGRVSPRAGTIGGQILFLAERPARRFGRTAAASVRGQPCKKQDLTPRLTRAAPRPSDRSTRRGVPGQDTP